MRSDADLIRLHAGMRKAAFAAVGPALVARVRDQVVDPKLASAKAGVGLALRHHLTTPDPEPDDGTT